MIPSNNKVKPVLLKGHEKILIYQRELFQESADLVIDVCRYWIRTRNKVGSATEKQCSGDFNDNIMNVVLVLIGCVGNLAMRLFN